MPFTRPEYSREDVNRAALLVLQNEPGDADWEAALEVVSNWRAAHGHALNTFQLWLRRHIGDVDENALVAQRLKRLPSILRKLRDRNQMRLTQMQDIGGVRAVVEDVRLVYALRELYVKSDLRHNRYHEDDYIKNPRDSGYRGVHLVFKYQSDKRGGAIYNGLKIEVQLRSRLQHTWATAVETVDTLLSQSLKASRGDPEWQRFFALMSSAMANIEGTALVPGTPHELDVLKGEIRVLARDLQVEKRLATFGTAIQHLGNASAKHHYFLLQLNSENKTVEATGFKLNQYDAATAAYLEAERNVKELQEEVVLVSVANINALQATYPNYYLDTQEFLQQLRNLLIVPA